MTQPEKPIPLIHTTDLYHPPQDPDDQVDLATALALDEFDLRGVILDNTHRFMVGAPEGFDMPRDPGFVLVSQLAYLMGRSIPVAVGPKNPLNAPDDAALDVPRQEQAGIELLLSTLAHSADPVVISVVGSTRVITAAYNREPALLREKTRAILLNAGSTGASRIEWNTGLDVHAFVGLWQSGLPIHWYPCDSGKSAFTGEHERGTFWKAPHALLFQDLPPRLAAWFAYGFSGSARADFIRALDELGKGAVWDLILEGYRNLWSTASLVMAAGRVLARTPHGWRFLKVSDAKGLPVWPWRLDAINAAVSPEGHIRWNIDESSQRTSLFGRRPDGDYGLAMTEALNALLKTLPA